MGRKRKVVYPKKWSPPRPAPGAPPEAPVSRSTVVSIDLAARHGRDGLAVGQRVRILGTGLYAGELAVIERLSAAVVPAATVRTEAGRTRQVRTIDLEPVEAGRESTAGRPEAAEGAAS
jgi:hypothetical protein